MKPPCIAAAILTAASTALGQASFTTDSTMTMAMAWSDNGLGNGNNDDVLEPGEAALITVTASFTNLGESAHFSPPVGGISSGTIIGFGIGAIDIAGIDGAEGQFNNNNPPTKRAGTSGFGVRQDWRIAGDASHGRVNATGVDNIEMGQMWLGSDYPRSTDPITNIFRLLWTPASFQPRTTTFSIVGTASYEPQVAAVLLDLGGAGLYAYLPASNIQFGSVDIPLAPAASAFWSLVVPAASLGARRRTRPNRRALQPSVN